MIIWDMTRIFTIYDTDDQKSLMKDVCRKMNIDTKIYKERSLLAQISHAKDELLTPDDMEMKAAGDYNMKKWLLFTVNTRLLFARIMHWT